jgi:hypothetical protein
MNFRKRLNALSVDELHRLQKAILGEIRHRKQLSAVMSTVGSGSLPCELKLRRSGSSVAVLNLSLDAEQPSRERYAA